MNDYESEHETMFEGDCITEAIGNISEAICEHIANDPPETVALIGIQAGGVPLAKRIARCIRERNGREIDVGTLDISMYRDDIGKRKTLPMIRETVIPFDINDKIIILADDVLQSGRSVRAALDALTDFGRPGQIRLAALIDRGGREFPIHADYVGMKVSVAPEWRVCMDWAECNGTDSVFKVKKQ
ncbi:MAG: bifunctional pyr operon transcriptional regulator/uracil phosphoribosyltransferase PyrR [Lentisphaeria bacterium]|nr:bifunctional pyr operon transcriptional regulator/uracil phosphoribosyltransferase PyrR [Lentisphaeria bacterium]